MRARFIFLKAVLFATALLPAMQCATHNYRNPALDRLTSCHDYSKNHNLFVDFVLVDLFADPLDTTFSTALDLVTFRPVWDHNNGIFSGASNMGLTLASLAPFYHHRDYQSMLARLSDLDYNDSLRRYCEPHVVGIVTEPFDY